MLKLGSRGARLSAISACPADSGGLVTLLTGFHARQHGYLSQTRGLGGCAGWAAELVSQGYHVAGVGNVGMVEPFLSDATLVEPVEKVDAIRCSYLAAAESRGQKAAVQQQRRQRLRSGPFEPDRLLLEPDEDIDGYIMEAARLKLESMPTDKPWVLLVILTGPANDLPPPPLYDGIVDRRALEAGFMPANMKTLDDLGELDYPRSLLQRLEPAVLARIRSDYLGRVSMIDYGIGRLMAGVENRPDRGRSWFVVASDRGQMLGEHGIVGHRAFMLGAIEVPVLIAPGDPAVHQKSEKEDLHICDGQYNTVDVAATIAALTGCDLPEACVGRSLLPTLTNEPVMPSLAGGNLSEFGHRLMLETERYKIIFDVQAHRPLALFDLLNDPDELHNLSEAAVGKNLIDAMRWRIGEALMAVRSHPYV